MSSFKDDCPDPDKVNNGVKMPLLNRDGGISEDYIMVRWLWSDEVRAALDNLERQGQKEITRITEDMTAKQKKAAQESNDEVSARLILEGRVAQVAGWSFDEKPTATNIKAYLKSRPDVAKRVDVIADTNKLFFTDSGKSS